MMMMMVMMMMMMMMVMIMIMMVMMMMVVVVVVVVVCICQHALVVGCYVLVRHRCKAAEGSSKRHLTQVLGLAAMLVVGVIGCLAYYCMTQSRAPSKSSKRERLRQAHGLPQERLGAHT